MVSLVLVSFNKSLVSLDHGAKWFNPLLMIESAVPSFLLGNKRLVSSSK